MSNVPEYRSRLLKKQKHSRRELKTRSERYAIARSIIIVFCRSRVKRTPRLVLNRNKPRVRREKSYLIEIDTDRPRSTYRQNEKRKDRPDTSVGGGGVVIIL